MQQSPINKGNLEDTIGDFEEVIQMTAGKQQDGLENTLGSRYLKPNHLLSMMEPSIHYEFTNLPSTPDKDNFGDIYEPISLPSDRQDRDFNPPIVQVGPLESQHNTQSTTATSEMPEKIEIQNPEREEYFKMIKDRLDKRMT